MDQAHSFLVYSGDKEVLESFVRFYVVRSCQNTPKMTAILKFEMADNNKKRGILFKGRLHTQELK